MLVKGKRRQAGPSVAIFDEGPGTFGHLADGSFWFYIGRHMILLFLYVSLLLSLIYLRKKMVAGKENGTTSGELKS